MCALNLSAASGAASTGRANKHQLRTEATKRKLIAAAYQIFTRDGFEAARIEDIATLAGFTRGAYYAHFDDKNEIFFALLEAKVEESREKLAGLLDAATSQEERRAAFRDYFIRSKTDRQWAILLIEFKLYALRHTQQREQLADAHRSIRRKMSGWLKQQAAFIGFAATEPEEYIRAGLEGAYMGVLLERSYDPRRISDQQVRELLGKLFDALLPCEQ